MTESDDSSLDNITERVGKLTTKQAPVKRRGGKKMAVFCAGGKNCGKRVEQGAERCPKGHKCDWSTFICTHCENELKEVDGVGPLMLQYCTFCDTRIHGGIANRWSITIH